MIFELKFEDIVLVNFISLKRVNTDGMRVVWMIRELKVEITNW